MLLYSRKKVRYRRDGYCWKKRKDGKTTREDHMKLKVQGMEVITIRKLSLKCQRCMLYYNRKSSQAWSNVLLALSRTGPFAQNASLDSKDPRTRLWDPQVPCPSRFCQFARQQLPNHPGYLQSFTTPLYAKKFSSFVYSYIFKFTVYLFDPKFIEKWNVFGKRLCFSNRISYTERIWSIRPSTQFEIGIHRDRVFGSKGGKPFLSPLSLFNFRESTNIGLVVDA